MELLMLLVIGAVAVFAAGQLFAKTDSPFTIAELSRTQVGIDNTPPATLLVRLRGLGVVAGQLRDAGFTITSAYRGEALDNKVIDDNTAAGNGNLGVKGDGPHRQGRALDVGLDRKHPTSSSLATAIRATSPGQLANQVLPEVTDVHLTFDAADLDEIGALFIAANPFFDVEGAALLAGTSAQGLLANIGQELEIQTSGATSHVFQAGETIPANVDPSTAELAPGTFASTLQDGTIVVQSI